MKLLSRLVAGLTEAARDANEGRIEGGARREALLEVGCPNAVLPTASDIEEEDEAERRIWELKRIDTEMLHRFL